MHDLTYPSRAVSHQNLERQLADHTRQKKVCVSDQMPNSICIYIYITYAHMHIAGIIGVILRQVEAMAESIRKHAWWEAQHTT